MKIKYKCSLHLHGVFGGLPKTRAGFHCGLALYMRLDFYKWKSSFIIRESEKKNETKRGDFWGRQWTNRKWGWFIVWYEGMVSQSGINSHSYTIWALRRHFLAKTVLSHEWKPLAIDDLGWIRHIPYSSSHSPLWAHSPIRSTEAERCPRKKKNWSYRGGVERTASSRVVFLSLWLVRYHPDKSFLSPQKRATANCFNGFPLR